MNLPLPVMRKRLAAARRVLSFGISNVWRANNQTSFSTSLLPSCVRLVPFALFVPLALMAACRSELQAADLPLHWPTKAPPAIAGSNPVVWVGIAERLPAAAAPLELRAAAGLLTLRDSKGVQRQADRFEIHWVRQPLARPLLLERRVLGPFPSYESAYEQARLWRLKGAQPLLARPGDWEVWAPLEGPAPDGISREVRLNNRLHWQPQLRQAGQVLNLDGPIQLKAPRGLLWNGGVYGGPFRLQRDAYGTWALVEQVPLETYLQGVVPHEIGASAPAAAQAAQAVLARTWALANQQRFHIDGYHLCADSQCQVYGDPSQVGSKLRLALDASKGLLLTWKGKPVHGVYSASNGGVSAGFEEGWGGGSLPYLKAQLDGPGSEKKRFPLPIIEGVGLNKLLEDGANLHGAAHPRHRWQRRISSQELAALAASAKLGNVQNLLVQQRGPSGRVVDLLVQGSEGSLNLRRDQIRRRLRQLPSTLFVVVKEEPGVWRFDGAGFGHGVGLSQAGAIELAQKGWSSAQILKYYFPGTVLEKLKSLPR